jgi:hypothetical protein
VTHTTEWLFAEHKLLTLREKCNRDAGGYSSFQREVAPLQQRFDEGERSVELLNEIIRVSGVLLMKEVN